LETVLKVDREKGRVSEETRRRMSWVGEGSPLHTGGGVCEKEGALPLPDVCILIVVVFYAIHEC